MIRFSSKPLTPLGIPSLYHLILIFGLALFIVPKPLHAARKVIDMSEARARRGSPPSKTGGNGSTRCESMFSPSATLSTITPPSSKFPADPWSALPSFLRNQGGRIATTEGGSNHRDLSTINSLPEILVKQRTNGQMILDRFLDREVVQFLLEVKFDLPNSPLVSPAVFPVFKPIFEREIISFLEYENKDSAPTGIGKGGNYFITIFRDSDTNWIHIYSKTNLSSNREVPMEIIIDVYRGDNQSTSGIVLESYSFDGEKLVSTDPESVNGFKTVLDRVGRITEMDKTSSIAEGALIPLYYIEYGGQ